LPRHQFSSRAAPNFHALNLKKGIFLASYLFKGIFKINATWKDQLLAEELNEDNLN